MKWLCKDSLFCKACNCLGQFAPLNVGCLWPSEASETLRPFTERTLQPSELACDRLEERASKARALNIPLGIPFCLILNQCTAMLLRAAVLSKGLKDDEARQAAL